MPHLLDEDGHGGTLRQRGLVAARPVARVLLLLVNDYHIKGVAIGISIRLQPSVVEVIPVDEPIMRLRLKHSLGLMSFVAVYAPMKPCKTEEKEMFYAKLHSVLTQCLFRGVLIVWH